MVVFYRGAGINTYWHQNDARLSGFTAQFAGGPTTIPGIVNHIRVGTTRSPFISLTRSFGIAWSYAMFLGQARPTSAVPAYVYEIHLPDPAPLGLTVVDPISQLAQTLPSPLSTISYQHDGLPDFLLGVIDPATHHAQLTTPIVTPPPGGATPRTPTLTHELEMLVRALRDAELLAIGAIPASCIIHCHSVF